MFLAFLLLVLANGVAIYLAVDVARDGGRDSARQDAAITAVIRQNAYDQCIRGNEFRGLLADTFEGVVTASLIPSTSKRDRDAQRDFRRRVRVPLDRLLATVRPCGPRP